MVTEHERTSKNAARLALQLAAAKATIEAIRELCDQTVAHYDDRDVVFCGDVRNILDGVA